MEVKSGYKMTDVGIIPEEWEVRRLSDIATIVRGGSPRPAGDPRYFNGSFIPWLTVAALTNIPDYKTSVSETFGFLTKEGSLYSRFLPSGTLIIANSGATLGIAKTLSIDCCANDGIAALLNQTSGDRKYICYFINTQSKRLREVIATGNGQPNLNTTLIGNIFIPWPPSEEQAAIASALGDVDALIGSLDRLIAKKRDIKQAAMQQLLSGQTRLPGFSGEWEVKRLGEIAVLSSKRNSTCEKLPVLTCSKHLGMVESLGYFKNQVFSKDLSQYKVIHKGQLGYPANHIEEGSIGIQQLYEVALVSPIYIVFSVVDGVNGIFLHKLLKQDSYRQIFKKVTTSTVDRRGSLRWPVFSEIIVTLPSIKEQIAIAEVLTDLDSELAALENRREKTRLLKQGMMQELLSGRTRLV